MFLLDAVQLLFFRHIFLALVHSRLLDAMLVLIIIYLIGVVLLPVVPVLVNFRLFANFLDFLPLIVVVLHILCFQRLLNQQRVLFICKEHLFVRQLHAG